MQVLGAHYAPPKDLVLQKDIQNFTNYFARPHLITSGVLPSTRSQIWEQAWSPNSIFNVTLPASGNRVLGAFGARFTMVFTLQVAATPFHQGMVVLGAEYYSGAVNTRGKYPVSCTNLPHVRCDISTNTMVQLRIPFLAPTDYMAIGDPSYYLSSSLNAVLPVETVAGMAPPTYKLYVHLEDVQLFGVRPYSVQPYLPPALLAKEEAVEQSGGKGPFEKEFENESHPFSSGLGALGRSVRWIAKGVPSLASIAGPASWALGKAAGAARYFGYSKPQITDPPHRMLMTTGALENNVDVPACVQVLAPIAENHLSVSPSFGNTDVDEMSLKYVLSQYNQLAVGRLTTSDSHGSLIWAFTVEPNSAMFRTSNNMPVLNVSNWWSASQVVQPTGFAYFGRMFAMWRGSLKLRFTFAKTKMHAGRVAVTYIPRQPSSGTSLEIVSYASGFQPEGYHAIFDLKDSNVFEFKVPYVSNMPWAHVATNTGTVSLQVIDPLIASAVVAPSVQFLVECACDSDFELAFPLSSSNVPSPDSAPVEQSGGVSVSYKEDVCESTMGECITSLKQLIMIPSTYQFQYAGKKTTADIMPWYYQASLPASAGTHGFGGQIACCYSYVRGSTDIHIYTPPDQNLMYSRIFMRLATQNSTDAAQYVSCAPHVFGTRGAIHVRCPSYQHTPRIPSRLMSNLVGTWNLTYDSTADTFPNGTVQLTGPMYGTAVPVILPRMYLEYTGTTNVPVVVRRNAGDDAMATQYIGPPPVKSVADNDTIGYSNVG